MRIRLFLIVLFAISAISFAKQINSLFMAKGTIDFTSDAPLEVIKASSDKLVGALDIDSKDFYFRVYMNTFEGFNSALQREHFNENYLETHKYPKAIFKGRIIEDIDYSQEGTYTIRAKGKLNIHGIENNRIIKCKLRILNENLIEVSATFTVFLSEHNIKIPNIVNQKIAEEIDVLIKTTLKPKN